MGGSILGGRFELVEVIGRGATGRVWRAVDTESGPVAVKVLAEELSADSVVVARFKREQSILTGLSHPNLVEVRAIVAEDGRLAIVMDLVDGGDLRTWFVQRGRLAPAAACAVAAQVFAALGVVHGAGIAHRDLKPENILLERAGDESTLMVRLTDFGIAHAADSPTLTRLTGVIGTPDYMAPELSTETHGTSAVDVYSTGVILYESLFGRTPFGGGHPVAVLRRHEDQAPFRPAGTPEELWSVLERLLAKDPHGRPDARTAELAVRQLAEHLVGLGPLPALTAETLDEYRGRLPTPSTDANNTIIRNRPQQPEAIALEAPTIGRGSKRRFAVLTGVAMLALTAGMAVARPGPFAPNTPARIAANTTTTGSIATSAPTKTTTTTTTTTTTVPNTATTVTEPPTTVAPTRPTRATPDAVVDTPATNDTAPPQEDGTPPPTAQPTPSAPRNAPTITSANFTGSQICSAWTAVEGAEWYDGIYDSNVSGHGTLPRNSGATQGCAAAAPGQHVCFQLRAGNSVGPGPYSVEWCMDV